MKLALAGGSGLIGAALSRSLVTNGHIVRRLVRRPSRSGAEVEWQPATGQLPMSALDDLDAVICLNGARISPRRLTAGYRRALRDSRITPVATLARALATSGGPRVFLCASAVGYYGDRGEEILDESAGAGQGFLADLCQEWESAADPAREAGIRVCHLRSGLVLSASGGLLARLRPLVALGVAGRMGSGRQFQPTISLADEVDAIRFILENDAIRGAVNVSGPEPVSNQEFVDTLAKLLDRPAALSIPEPLLRVVFGEFADVGLLASERVVPAELARAGFTFRHQTLRQQLDWALEQR